MSKKLPQGWKKVKLADISDIKSGGTPSRSNNEYWNNGNIPWIKISDIKEKYINNSEEFITQEGLDNSSTKLFSKGTILFTIFATLGEVGILNIDATTNQAIAGIKVNEEIVNREYLYYFLRSLKETIESNGRGVAQKNINLSILREYEILLPPLEEQERIVFILERAENAIRKREESNRLLDEYLKSVFVDMFGDPVTNPKGWHKIKLKDFGKVVTGNTPSRKQEEYYGDYIEWIKSDNINTPYHYLTQAEEYLSEKGCNVGRKVPKGSILITCIAGSRSCIGNCAIANRDVTFNQQINAIVPNEDVNNNFLYAQLLVGKSVVQSYSTNSMKGMISKGVFENIEFMYPPTELQNEFGDIFDKINAMKNKCEEELAGLNNLFNSLMQRAFNGEL